MIARYSPSALLTIALFLCAWVCPLFAETAQESPDASQAQAEASFEKRMSSYRESLERGEKAKEPLASIGVSMAKNLAIIVGLFLVGSFLYKKYVYKGNGPSSGVKSLHIVERLGLGPKASLYLVRVQEKHLVLAVTDAQVTQISTDSDVLARADFAKVEEEMCSEISQVG